MKQKSSRTPAPERRPDWRWQDEEEPGRHRWRFLLVPAVVIVMVSALVWLFQAQAEDSAGPSQQITFGGKATGTAPKVASAAPDFTLPSLEGKNVSLSSFRGKVVLLNFFATWCPPCRAEMPDLEATYQELKGKGLEIVAVDLQEDQGTVSGYVKSLGLTFTILLDREATVFGQYHITGLPTSYFIDRQGIVRDYTIGALNKKRIMQKLEKLF